MLALVYVLPQFGDFGTLVDPGVAVRHCRYCYFHMPYRTSVRLALVASADIPGTVGGESWVQHSDAPFAGEAYFHARFAYQPALRFPWQPAVFSPAGGWKGPGQLVGLSMRFSAPKEWAAQFPGTMEHVCEGNWELYIDNTTELYGNDSTVDPARVGYQASEHVVVVTGSEDMFGYSFGWAEQTTGSLSGTPLWAQSADGVDLSTYAFVFSFSFLELGFIPLIQVPLL